MPDANITTSDSPSVGVTGWKQIAFPAVVGLLILFFQLPFYHLGIGMLDEGFQLSSAERILRGDLIYRDFTVVPGPLSFYFTAAALKLFGSQVIVMRWILVLNAALTASVVAIIARRLMSWPFAAAAGLLIGMWNWMIATPNLYTWQAYLLSYLAVLFYLVGVERRRVWWYVGSGVFAGVATLAKQNSGVYCVLALVLSQLISGESASVRTNDTAVAKRETRARWRRLAALVGSAAAASIPVFLLLIFTAGWHAVYENWWWYYRYMYKRTMGIDFPSLFPLTIGASPLWYWEATIKLLAYSPCLLFPFAAIRLMLLKRRSDDAARGEFRCLLPISIFCVLQFLHAWPRSDDAHIVIAFLPSFLLMSYALFCLWRRVMAFVTSAQKRQIFGAAIGAIVFLPLLWSGRTAWNRTAMMYQNCNTPLDTSRSHGIYATAREAVEMARVVHEIDARTKPDEPILVLPWAAIYYFLAGRPNPTRNDLLYDRISEPADSIPMLEEVQRVQPRLVVYTTRSIDGRAFEEYARPLYDYLRSNYRVIATTLENEILERNSQ